MRRLFIMTLMTVCVMGFTGCGEKASDLSKDVQGAIESLNDIQSNYAAGTAPAVEIPVVYAQELYDNADAIIGSDIEGAPISLREYAATDTVYFDYADDFSVVWDKGAGTVSVEATDVEEREAFKQKMHK